jgi:hypothetical protein
VYSPEVKAPTLGAPVGVTDSIVDAVAAAANPGVARVATPTKQARMAALAIFMENLLKIPLSRLNTGHRGGQLQHRLNQFQLEPFRTNSRNLPLLANL